MTVITKPIIDKKIDKLDQPLVPGEVLPHRDVENGAGPTGPQDTRMAFVRANARRASSVTTACLLLMALLVMCCGILGGFYLYKQFAHSQMLRLRGWCRIPYDHDTEQSAFIGDYRTLNENQQNSEYLNEEFDIEGELGNYEKINVPTFGGGRHSQFIHDFNANKTGIVDMDAHRCFVFPLNRTQVLPPKDLIDLVRKMWQGYYDVDTATVRETMRVVLPPVQDPQSGYIQHKCGDYPIYKLEKIVSGVFKRSIAEKPAVFTHFSGKNILELSIVNEEELKAYEMEHNHS